MTDSSRFEERSLFSSFADEVRPLWVSSFGLIQVLILGRLLPIGSPRSEKIQYLLLGLLFPAVVFWLTASTKASKSLLGRLLPWAQVVTASVGLLASIYLIRHGFVRFMVLGLAQTLLLWVCRRLFCLQSRSESGRGYARIYHFILTTLIISIGWGIAYRLQWWDAGGFHALVTRSRYTWGALAGATLLPPFAFASLWLTPQQETARFRWVFDVSAIALIAMFSVHVFGAGFRDLPGEIWGTAAYHHWSAIIAPAYLVTRGGWLLWDIPSQYGVASTFLLTLPPFSNVWQALYTWNALFITVSGATLFFILRSLHKGWLWYAFSLIVTLASVFMVPGYTYALTGPFIVPATGAFRFLWCYILLAILVWEYESKKTDSEPSRWILWFGTVAWLIGVLWSAESAIFCTTIWIPAYSILVIHHRRSLLKTFAWLAMPLKLLVTAIACITIFFLVRLGHAPDLHCYLDYILGSSFFAWPMNTHGAVAVLLLCYFIIVTICVKLAQNSKTLASVPMVVGAGAALWSASSYYVGRSHDANITNITPLIIVSLASALHAVVGNRIPDYRDELDVNNVACTSVPRYIDEAGERGTLLPLIPLLSAFLFLAFSNKQGVELYLHDVARGYNFDIARSIPSIDPAAQQLLDQVGLSPDSSVAYFDNNDSIPLPNPLWRPLPAGSPSANFQPWIPDTMVLLEPLNPVRREVYFSRFVGRTQKSGWLLRPKAPPSPTTAWALTEIEKTHKPARTVENATWLMTLYEIRSQGTGSKD